MLDISFPLTNHTFVYEGDPPLLTEKVSDAKKGDAFTVSRITFGSHAGTHVDFPSHFIPCGKSAADFTIEQLCGRARVFEIKNTSAITSAILKTLPIEKQDIVLFKTINAAFDGVHPLKDTAFLTEDGAEYLSHREIKMVGIDYFDIESEEDGEYTVHKILLSHDIPILETIDLRKVQEGIYTLYCLPLPIMGLDACPVRPVLVP